VLQSAIWDNINTDIAAALTQLATQANTTPTWSNILAPNGGFAIWQRGAGANASFSVNASTTQYTADRWYIITGANQATVVAAATGLTGAAPPAHACKITRTAAQTGITAYTFGYPLTADEVYRLRGQQVSFSGAAKSGANWSPALGAFTISLLVGTGTAQKAGVAGANFSGLSTPLTITTDLAAGATNTSITGTSAAIVPITSTQGEIQVTWTPVGTAGTDDSLTLDQFCLVAGAIVQSFEDLPFDTCLRECKKFFRKSFNYNVAPAQNAGNGGAIGAWSQAVARLGIYVNLEPIEMYVTAAVTTYQPNGASANWSNATSGASSAPTLDGTVSSGKGFTILTATVSNVDNYLFIHYTADAPL
jgi:hypothetical protein